MTKKSVIIAILGGLLLMPSSAKADEADIFTLKVPPNALIILDLSDSMRWTAAGGMMYTSSSATCGGDVAYYASSGTDHTKTCFITVPVPKYSNNSCSGPFYVNTNHTGYTTDCSRLGIAKGAIFNLLDDTHDGIITSTGTNTDDASLNINMGYMRFYGCAGEDTTLDWTKGCVTLKNGFGDKYSKIYCNSDNNLCTFSGSYTNGVSAEDAYGIAPLANALDKAKTYITHYEATDPAAACRNNFVILIAAGADTLACTGNGSDDQSDQYKRRKATVARAKALRDAGYKVFVIGFGSDMPISEQNTLNWAAYFGGTDNPMAGKSGDAAAITGSSDPCSTDSSNDPGNAPLSGYAFSAQNPADLAAALGQAMNTIRSADYSFSVPSVTSSWQSGEGAIYEASFEARNSDPFWKGHLYRYAVKSDGAIGDLQWDAGDKLKSQGSTGRNILTYRSGSTDLVLFSTVTKRDLAVATDDQRKAIVGYIQGDAAYNPDNWKLGDIFHSNIVAVGKPSPYFNDVRDTKHTFIDFRKANKDRTKIVIAGANDGQFHAFKAEDGTEAWSFVPPNLLPKLQYLAHSSHPIPTSLPHLYFADGPVVVRDVWLGTGDGTSKSDNWMTLAVMSVGRNDNIYDKKTMPTDRSTKYWSRSTSCDKGFSDTYVEGAYANYCGYYALDITDTKTPKFKWLLQPDSSSAPYLGEPWGKMAIGRIVYRGAEKWVGFIGGGYNPADCTGTGNCDKRGKAFFVVDLDKGSILKSFTSGDMKYSIAAPPLIIDTDGDGFIDSAYVGDLGGNMWKFEFTCKSGDVNCRESDWTGGKFYSASGPEIRPVYASITATVDPHGNLWLYWGTGDTVNPNDDKSTDYFYAVKDGGGHYPYAIGSLLDISDADNTFNDDGHKRGWYLEFAKGEKMLSSPTMWAGVLYFTTYTPSQSTDANPCAPEGTGKVYAVNYITGEAAFSSGRVIDSGSGPVGIAVSSGNGGTSLIENYSVMDKGNQIHQKARGIPGSAAMNRLIYWKDNRVGQ